MTDTTIDGDAAFNRGQERYAVESATIKIGATSTLDEGTPRVVKVVDHSAHVVYFRAQQGPDQWGEMECRGRAAFLARTKPVIAMCDPRACCGSHVITP